MLAAGYLNKDKLGQLSLVNTQSKNKKVIPNVHLSQPGYPFSEPPMLISYFFHSFCRW
jgi:hypothetical protein